MRRVISRHRRARARPRQLPLRTHGGGPRVRHPGRNPAGCSRSARGARRARLAAARRSAARARPDRRRRGPGCAPPRPGPRHAGPASRPTACSTRKVSTFTRPSTGAGTIAFETIHRQLHRQRRLAMFESSRAWPTSAASSRCRSSARSARRCARGRPAAPVVPGRGAGQTSRPLRRRAAGRASVARGGCSASASWGRGGCARRRRGSSPSRRTASACTSTCTSDGQARLSSTALLRSAPASGSWALRASSRPARARARRARRAAEAISAARSANSSMCRVVAEHPGQCGPIIASTLQRATLARSPCGKSCPRLDGADVEEDGLLAEALDQVLHGRPRCRRGGS